MSFFLIFIIYFWQCFGCPRLQKHPYFGLFFRRYFYRENLKYRNKIRNKEGCVLVRFIMFFSQIFRTYRCIRFGGSRLQKHPYCGLVRAFLPGVIFTEETWNSRAEYEIKKDVFLSDWLLIFYRLSGYFLGNVSYSDFSYSNWNFNFSALNKYLKTFRFSSKNSVLYLRT